LLYLGAEFRGTLTINANVSGSKLQVQLMYEEMEWRDYGKPVSTFSFPMSQGSR